MQTNGLLMVDFVGAVHAQLEGARGSFNPLVQLALKINERLHRTGERAENYGGRNYIQVKLYCIEFSRHVFTNRQ